MTYENFVGQFQLLCSQLLCVVNGTQLRIYDKSSAIPTNIRFDYKQRRSKLTEYYFRDIDNHNLYCVFGREAALVFFPRLDEVDPLTKAAEPRLEPSEPPRKKPIVTPLPTPTVTKVSQILIVDRGQSYSFPDPNYRVRIRTYRPL